MGPSRPVPLMPIKPQTQTVPASAQNSTGMLQENVEEPEVPQEGVGHVTPTAEAEVPASGLVKLINAQAETNLRDEVLCSLSDTR